MYSILMELWCSLSHLRLYDGARREGQLERGLGMEGGEAAGQPASVCQHLLGRPQVHQYAVALGELVDRALFA